MHCEKIIGHEVLFENRLAFWQLARQHACFVIFQLSVFLSLLSDVCTCGFFSRCGNDKFADGGHDLRINLFKMSVLWRVEFKCRWCCGRDLLFASVIATWFLFSFGFRIVLCRSCCSFFFGIPLLVSVVSGSAHQWQEGSEKPRCVQFCKLFFQMGRCCYCRHFLSDTFYFFFVCVISWPHKRVDPEECVMVFQHIFGPWHQHHQVCIRCKCGSLQAWTVVGSMVFFCVWQLMWSVMQRSGCVFSFDATRLTVFCTMSVLT